MAEQLCTELIERYLCTRGRRFFRGRHDGEYFFVADARPRRLYVHLEIPRKHSDVLTVRVTPVCFFPAADRAQLTEFAASWNRRNRQVAAVVQESSDPRRIGLAAHRSRQIGEIAFDDFSCFVDRVIGAAIELFADFTPIGGPASIAPPLLREAG
jgi:hypothetical protein